eukprot:gene10614-biopygen9281
MGGEVPLSCPRGAATGVEAQQGDLISLPPPSQPAPPPKRRRAAAAASAYGVAVKRKESCDEEPLIRLVCTIARVA